MSERGRDMLLYFFTKIVIKTLNNLQNYYCTKLHEVILNNLQKRKINKKKKAGARGGLLVLHSTGKAGAYGIYITRAGAYINIKRIIKNYKKV